MRTQVIVKLTDCVWDSIKDSPLNALFRVAEHMENDQDLLAKATGKRVKRVLIFGKGVDGAQAVLEQEGFSLEIKQI